MTNDIAELRKAIEELNTLVAERVMGWTLSTESVEGRTIDGKPLLSVWRWWHTGGGNILDADSWSPSTDIDTAWQVIEKFDSYELQRNRWLTSDRGKPPHYRATVTRYKPEGFGQAIAETQEVAICLAALQAVGVDALPTRPTDPSATGASSPGTPSPGPPPG